MCDLIPEASFLFRNTTPFLDSQIAFAQFTAVRELDSFLSSSFQSRHEINSAI